MQDTRASLIGLVLVFVQPDLTKAGHCGTFCVIARKSSSMGASSIARDQGLGLCSRGFRLKR